MNVVDVMREIRRERNLWVRRLRAAGKAPGNNIIWMAQCRASIAACDALKKRMGNL